MPFDYFNSLLNDDHMVINPSELATEYEKAKRSPDFPKGVDDVFTFAVAAFAERIKTAEHYARATYYMNLLAQNLLEEFVYHGQDEMPEAYAAYEAYENDPRPTDEIIGHIDIIVGDGG